MQRHAPSLSSDDEDLILAINASLKPSMSRKSAHKPATSSSLLLLPPTPANHGISSSPSAERSLTPPAKVVKPRISSQMAPAWQVKLEASLKAVVEREEWALRQVKLQQVLKENLNILFFDKVTPPSRLHALISTLTIQF
jgi:hypothetical protein